MDGPYRRGECHKFSRKEKTLFINFKNNKKPLSVRCNVVNTVYVIALYIIHGLYTHHNK